MDNKEKYNPIWFACGLLVLKSFYFKEEKDLANHKNLLFASEQG